MDFFSKAALAFLATCLTGLVIPGARAAELEVEAPKVRAPTRDERRAVKYGYERIAGTLRIRPSSPLLAAIEAGEEVEGFAFWRQPFEWDFPALSVKVANNSLKALLLSEVSVQVLSSVVDTRPVLVIESPSYLGSFALQNEGWGRVLSPRLELTMSDPSCSESSASVRVTPPVKEFLEGADVPLSSFVSPELRRACGGGPLCVTGRLRYLGEDARGHAYRFKTRVYLREPASAAPMPPSYEYDVFLKAGRSGYTVTRALAQEVAPGQTDHVLIRLGIDRSSRLRLRITLKDSAGKERWAGDVDLEAFVPRSGAALAGPARGDRSQASATAAAE